MDTLTQDRNGSRRGWGGTMPETAGFKAGLEDIVACRSTICLLDGIKGILGYCGYDIRDLAEHSTFEEVAYLLWYGELPKKEELDAFDQAFRTSGDLPDEVYVVLKLFPSAATPMEVLRTATSSLGHFDPDSGNTSREACLRKAVRLTARIMTLVTAHHRLRTNQEPVRPDPSLNLASNFLYMLSGKRPDPVIARAFDVALILHADHELNASTFAARVTAATMSDLYSSVTSAIGALKGPLHGGANEQVMRMLIDIGEPAKAEKWVTDALARKVKISGFGHRVYRTEDPRATILRQYSEQLGKLTGQTKWYEISREVERVVRSHTKVYPNVDFYSASCYTCMSVPIDLFTPIFACSRSTGWIAHILEQWSDNRLMRPRADYAGHPVRSYVPLTDR